MCRHVIFIFGRLIEPWFYIFSLWPNLFNHSLLLDSSIISTFYAIVNHKPHSCTYNSGHITHYPLRELPTGSNGVDIVKGLETLRQIALQKVHVKL